ALRYIIPAASAKDALVQGTPNNAKMNKLLVIFVSCASSLKKAGDPPSRRLSAFYVALGNACRFNTLGADDFAKAVGAVRKNNSKAAESDLQQGVAEFKLGTAQLAKARKALIAIGASNLFVA